MAEKVRIGMIGCGTVACYGHIPAISNCEEIELVALSDLNQTRLEELAEKYKVAAIYTDYRDLLARDDIDAVGVAVPLDQHHPVVLDAAETGKHVLCEKPIAQSVELAEEMIQAMEKAKRLFAINFELRHTEPMPQMKALLDQGVIGELKVIRGIGNWMGGRWAGEDRYRMLITVGLGPIVDCGIHHFDLCRWFSKSEFAEIHAIGTHIEDYPNPDHVIATGKMDNGVLFIIEQGWAYTHNTPAHEANLRHDLIGTEGLISYANLQCSIEGQENRREFSLYSKNECFRKTITSPAKAFDKMYSLFAKSIRQGHLIDLPSGYDGLQALKASLKALELAKCKSI
ncbi:MAG: Gfo/Idh/MocA family oxidoreductase [Armatimonadota bacterium]|nr:Gfo/Idh/MocA family oxidoreductase [Armatimonadota bacterium]